MMRPLELAVLIVGGLTFLAGVGYSAGAEPTRPSATARLATAPTYSGTGAVGPDAAPNAPCPGITASSPQTLSTRPPPGPLCPGVTLGTYIGGSAWEWATDVAVDAEGNTYVTGLTNSTDFPATPDGYDATHNGDFDAFLMKFNLTGRLVFSTFLGGSSFDRGLSVVVAAGGDVYIAGSTNSSDFPTTPDAFDRTYGGSTPGDTSFGGSDFDIILARFRADGTLAYSTYLGGSNRDVAWSIAVDSFGSVYLTGDTKSKEFPTTPGSFVARGPEDSGDPRDVFVTKMTPDGRALAYSSVFGGESGDQAYSIAVGRSGSAYLTGWTSSVDFPTTEGAFDSTFNGFGDAFVLRLNPEGTGLAFSTFLGSADREIADCEAGLDVIVDYQENVYVTGATCEDFPATAGAHDATPNGGSDAFLSKLDASGALEFSTLLGGTGNDEGYSTGFSESGQIVVAGLSRSSDFPTSVGAYDPTYNGGGDGFVTRVEPTGSGLNYSTFVGGGDTYLFGNFLAYTCEEINPLCGDIVRSIALHPNGNFTLVGSTSSADLPATLTASDSTYNGLLDAFLVRIDFLPEPERRPTAYFDVNFVPDAPLVVVADASGSADAEYEKARLVVRWDWEDDGVWDTGWSATKVAFHTYEATGRYTIRVEVRDPVGLSASTSRQVWLGGPTSFSVFVLATPELGVAPLTVSFVSDVTGGVPPLSYLWEFGDAQRSESPSPIHIYEDAGTYPVTFNATDSAGHSVTSRLTIVVEAPSVPVAGGIEPLSLVLVAAVPSGAGLILLLTFRARVTRRRRPGS